MFEPSASSHRQPHGHGTPHHAAPRTTNSAGDIRWVCPCGRLLGALSASRLRLKPHDGDEYLVSFPTTCKCRRCGALNEVSGAHDLLRPRHAGARAR